MIENNPNDMSLFLKILISLKDILVGGIGGFIVYLFDYSKAKRTGEKFVFRWTSLSINIALGAYVGYVVGTMIPQDYWWRDAIISMCGVTSYQILLLAQTRFANTVLDKIDSVLKGAK